MTDSQELVSSMKSQLEGLKKLTVDIEAAREEGFPARKRWGALKSQKLDAVFEVA